MTQIVQCVLLVDHANQWAAAYTGAFKQVRVKARSFIELLHNDAAQQDVRYWATHLLHYDLAIVAVSPQNLAQVRSQLHYARTYLRTPVLVLVHQLKPIAIQDLLDAGASDFILAHSFATELPIRVKILRQRFYQTTAAKSLVYGGAPPRPSMAPALALNENSVCLDSYTAAVAKQYAERCQSFKQAKKTVVQRFEKAYIRAALVRHQGNITRAARDAQKHRRSFWELMRKHNIDADIYKVSACPDQ